MQTVNIHEAKTHLSRLVSAIKCGEEAEVIIAQNGIPAARLVPLMKKPKIKCGLRKGRFDDMTLSGRDFLKELERALIEPMPIKPIHMAMLDDLPMLHCDPFDRLLIATA